MSWNLNSFKNNDELSNQLCLKIADQLRADINSNAIASLVVSGGNTPELLFSKLSQQRLDWSKVVITLADERWLPANHSNANAHLVKHSLLQNQAAAAHFVSLTTTDSSPFSAEDEVDRRLKESLAWPLSTVVLGMGNDGHTASLFPSADTLSNALGGLNSDSTESLCCALTPPDADYQRMTLTAPALLNCRNLILYIGGQQKLKILESAIRPGAAEALPIRAFLHQDSLTMQIYHSDQ